MGDLVRQLSRHQWVRLHGTPRVTVLAGGPPARALWQRWLEVTARTGVLLEVRSTEDQDGKARAKPEHAFDPAIREAVTRAAADPAQPIAVLVARAVLEPWRTGRADRLAAMVDEGLILVDDDLVVGDGAAGDGNGRPAVATRTTRPRPAPALRLDANSAAEAALFEALEATPATAGRFVLNGDLSVRFGPRAAEVDLLSRGDRIAIEIDGIHHFADPDCYRRDRRKDLLLQGQGLLVVRLLAEDVLRDPRGSVTVVCQALAYRNGARER